MSLSNGISRLMTLSGILAVGSIIFGIKWDDDPQIPQIMQDGIMYIFMGSLGVALICLCLKIIEWAFKAMTFSPTMNSRTATRLVAGAAIYKMGKNAGKKGK